MKFDTHGNGHGMDDLYCLPENVEERKIFGQKIGRAHV